MTVTRIRRLVVPALGALALLAPASVSATEPFAPPAQRFGVNAQKLVFEFPESAWDAHFAAMRAAGVEHVRFDAIWQDAEPRPPVLGQHQYSWQRLDPIVTRLARHGLRWLPIIDYSTRWSAERTDHYASPPRDPALYGKFARAVATRYGPGGSFWSEHPELTAVPVVAYEIWNEPNHSAHWYPTPDPTRYADLYLAAHREIKAADPAAEVWIGGLAGDGAPDFIRAMYGSRPQLRGNVDAVGVHPYAQDADGVVQKIAALRAVVDELGEADVPLVVTEVGWFTQGSGPGYRASDDLRARYLESLIDAVSRSDCGVAGLFPHTWATREGTSLSAGDWFGLYRPNAIPHLSGTAYTQAAVAAAQRPRGESAELELCGRVPGVAVSRSVKRVAPTRGRRRVSTCHEASVTLKGIPLGGARVQFSYLERIRGRTRRRAVERFTDAAGRAAVCRRRPVRRRPALRLSEMTVSRPDVRWTRTGTRAIRLP